MKNRINLFTSKKRSEELSPIILKLKKYGLFTALAFGVVISSTYGANYWLQLEISKLNNENQVLQQYLTDHKDLEGKTGFFVFKKQLLKKYMRDDARFSDYYALLQKLMEDIQGSPVLEKFSLDNNQLTTFSLTFSDYETANRFITKLESPVFLQFFKTLEMDSFTTTPANDKQAETYRVELKGVFKPIQ